MIAPSHFRAPEPTPGPLTAPTYRPLHADELAELRPQFVRFLAAQGIPGDLYERMQREEPERVAELLERFSALVFDDVIRRARYLERRSARQLLVYEAAEDVLRVRGIVVAGDTALDLRREDPPAEMMARLTARGARLKLLSAERAYGEGRPAEVFALLEAGAKLATSSELYDLLNGLASDAQAGKSQT